jgi:hypothetical protein
MPPVWMRLETPAFGKAKGTVLKAELSDSRASALLNAGLATQVPDPGGTPPELPAPTAPGALPDAAVTALLADPATVAAIVATVTAAHDTDAEREGFVPTRLSDAALRAGYGRT